jgi:hypothetical protein
MRGMRLRVKCSLILWRNGCHHQATQGGPDGSAPELPPLAFTSPHLTLFFNGSLRKQRARAGALLLTPDEEQFKYTVHLEFKETNNMAEYDPLIFELSTALSLGV